MIKKTRGIVFSYLKYRDSSIIVRCFTEEDGLQSLIVNNIRSAKSKRSIGIYQPFNLIELVIYWKESQTIHRVSDAKIAVPLHSLHSNIHKTTIALFLAEFLQKVLAHEQTENHPLFNYIFDSIQHLESQENYVENFHVQFLLKLTPYLGFGFDSIEFLNMLDHKDEENAIRLLNEDFGYELELSSDTRSRMLKIILQFYRTHIDSLSEIKSLKVLQQIFH